MSLLVEVGNGALGIWIPREEKALEAEFDPMVRVTKNYPRGSLGWRRQQRGLVAKPQAEEVELGLLEGLLRRQETEGMMAQSQELWKPEGMQREENLPGPLIMAAD